MKISMIIATYNRGEKLQRTLESIANQTLAASEWEAVIVNNNSVDDTAEVFERFVARHQELNLRMVEEKRQGLSWARNKGIEEAWGEIIAIIDDDEEVNPEFLEVYVDFFERHPEVSMAGGKVVPRYEREGDAGGRPRWMSRFTERPIAGTLDLGPCEKPFKGRNYPAGGNMAIRRSAFENYGMFNTSLGRTGNGAQALLGGEEKELFGRIAAGSNEPTVWWVPGAVIYHIIPPSKLTLDYFKRLSHGVGESTKAMSRENYLSALIKEGGKWIATLGIALFWILTLRPAKARYLIIMRTGITRGLLG